MKLILTDLSSRISVFLFHLYLTKLLGIKTVTQVTFVDLDEGLGHLTRNKKGIIRWRHEIRDRKQEKNRK